ncbi:hypothetical protein P4C99_15645 [Pontiellaceae bacterium B1224]|nr:hypothetical protein [Pontiellaceae bacterium B1224]
MEQLELIEQRMERSFLLDRFDTFNQLLSERFILLKQARKLQENNAFFEQARKQTNRWNEVLGKRICEHRQRQKQAQAMSGYCKEIPSGRVLNRSL